LHITSYAHASCGSLPIIECEQESDAVRMGKHIHKTSYKRKKKEVGVDGVIVVDWIDHEEK